MQLSRTQTRDRRRNQVDRWCAAFEQECRARGIRVTPQRLAVYRALAEDLTHPTADAVCRRLTGHVAGMSPATVYRTLEFLERENLIRRVSAPQAVGRFDANVEFHQHIVCRICGTLTDIVVPELRSARLPAVPGFKVEELDIRLVGRCNKCSAAKPTTRGRRPKS